jgi:predicted XRE-type DNA-binding protein
MAGKHASLQERFLRFVPASAGKDECWEWLGHKNKDGYGSLWDGHAMVKAHRASWQIANSKHIPAGMFICHHCDNPACVNPAHLYLGTPWQNVQDRNNRERTARLLGSANPVAKLTEKQVKWIFAAYSTGMIQTEIASALGIRQTTVSEILRGNRWRHIFPGKIKRGRP